MRPRALALVCLLVCTTGYAERGVDRLRSAAAGFLALLEPDERKAAIHELEDDARATWSNLPVLMAPPAGVMLSTLDDAERQAVHEMLRASLSSQGYAKSAAIMWLDDVLGVADRNDLGPSSSAFARAMAETRNSGNYAVAVFGKPDAPSWGWKITGHHLAVNVTVAGDRLGFMPIFLGSNPRVVPAGPYAGWMALPLEGRLGIELMRSLDDTQRETALLADHVPADIFEGPGRRASLDKREGLSAARMHARQLNLLQALVAEYLGNADPKRAGEQLDAVAGAGWRNVTFSWRGAIAEDGRFYYRVHGPRILIEYNRQNENHDHAVLRDPRNDYGEQWLEHHYAEYHPSMDAVMQDVRRRVGPD